MPDEATVRQAVAQYFTAARAGDADAWLDTFAPDAVSHDPWGAPPHRGHGELRAFFEGITDAFDKVALHEEDVFVSGNAAAVRWIGDGTGKNGRKVTFEGIDVFTVGEDGKIQELRAYWDPASVMEQIQD